MVPFSASCQYPCQYPKGNKIIPRPFLDNHICEQAQHVQFRGKTKETCAVAPYGCFGTGDQQHIACPGNQ